MSLTGRMHTMINMPIRKALAPLQMYQLSRLSPRVSPRRSIRTVSLAGPDVQRRENHVCGRIPRTAWPHLRRKEAMRHHGAPPLRHGAPPLFRRETTLRRTVFAGMVTGDGQGAATHCGGRSITGAPTVPLREASITADMLAQLTLLSAHHRQLTEVSSRSVSITAGVIIDLRPLSAPRGQRLRSEVMTVQPPAPHGAIITAGMVVKSPLLTAQTTSHQHGASRGWRYGSGMTVAGNPLPLSALRLHHQIGTDTGENGNGVIAPARLIPLTPTLILRLIGTIPEELSTGAGRFVAWSTRYRYS